MNASPTRPRGRSILLIEDDPDVRAGYAMLLEDEGYRIAEASNGHEGLEKLRTSPRPCLILLDMMMPRMNGLEFIEAMSRDDRLAPIPVVIASAYTHLAPATAGRVVAFMKKPVDPEVLLAWVRHFCGPSGAHGSSEGR